VKQLAGRNKGNELSACTEFAVTSGVPVFTVYYYLGESIGFNEKLLSRMKNIAKFYGYTKILATNPAVEFEQFVSRDIN
jgi:hypothetical protein